MKGELAIYRNSGQGTITIEVIKGHHTLFEIKVLPEDFSKALTGLAGLPCEVSFNA